MECERESLSDHGARRVWVRRRGALAVLVASMVLTAVSACSSESAREATPKTSESTDTTRPVAVTEPVPPATKDCGTHNALAGWPTTMVTSPDAFACILDALVTGNPAQMSAISAGSSDSGRKTQDGYDIPTRQITTWLVLGRDEVQVTTDLTEDGGTSTTQTCTGLVAAGYGSLPQGTDCS